MYKTLFKPVADFIVALTALIILSPILLMAIVGLALANRGRVWFFQDRPGLKGKHFKIIKFKTMTDQQDTRGELLPDEQRLTGFGRLIRKTSIDELPQLINVIRGDMSIVGPRPLLIEYIPLYNEVQRKRHDVKPGITGWAQVNGRNAITWKQKFDYDVWYVNRISFVLDLKILFLTLYKVVKADGINASEKITMEKFTGEN